MLDADGRGLTSNVLDAIQFAINDKNELDMAVLSTSRSDIPFSNLRQLDPLVRP